MAQFEIFFGDSYDPYQNLAVEEALFLRKHRGVTLYLWQNEHTVVIGKNQCAYTECRLEDLRADGGRLARRTSGGGAVYHDMGNLNYTFLADPEHYDLDKQISVIRQAIATFGIETEASGRNDLVLKPGGEKFSGNAFRASADMIFQHGTLLVDVNLEKLGQYLNPPAEKYESKGVKSVQARVKNLSSVNPAITVSALREALVNAFTALYGLSEVRTPASLDAASIKTIAKTFSSEQWRLGRLPAYDVELSNRFSFGRLDFLFQLSAGRVLNCVVYGDVMDPALPEKLSLLLKDVPFAPAALSEQVKRMISPMAPEISEWFLTQTI